MNGCLSIFVADSADLVRDSNEEGMKTCKVPSEICTEKIRPVAPLVLICLDLILVLSSLGVT